jgi:hypothetical protein
MRTMTALRLRFRMDCGYGIRSSRGAEHLALPLLAPTHVEGRNQRRRNPEQRRKTPEPVQLELLT